MKSDQSVIALAAGLLSCMAHRDLATFARSLASVHGEDMAKDVMIALALLAACDEGELDGIMLAAAVAAEA